MSELRSHFDYVIVIRPRCCGYGCAILAAGSDGVLVIARFAGTKRVSTHTCCRESQKCWAPILVRYSR